MVKLIVSDVDGTLVPDGSFDINIEIFDVIKALKEKNITFVAGSGRQYASLRRLFEPVADDILYITDNGGFVRDSNRDTWSSSPMDKDLVKELIRDAEKLEDIQVMLCGLDFAYISNEDCYLYRWLRDSYKYNVKAVSDLTTIDEDIVKVSLYHPTDAETVVKEWFYDKWKDKTLIASAGVNWMDCIRYDSNKGTALKYVMERMNISKDEVMVFGDNINDIEMLSCATYSYAIGNAREEVKQAANYVADTMMNQGVIKEIKKQILEK